MLSTNTGPNTNLDFCIYGVMRPEINELYLVHEFPTFLHGLFVHGPGLVMGVVEVMVRLKRVLHHADQPAAFLQISCHVSAPGTRTA